MNELIWVMIPLFFIISLVYTSVGLGGGSSYVAFLALFGMPLVQIPPTALCLNIIAASIAMFRFSKRGYLVPHHVIPLLLTSIPAAYFGAMWKPGEKVLSLVFAITLFLVALILLFRRKELKPRIKLDKKGTYILLPFLGALFGFLAGMMGIGGGVFLGPLLLLIGFSSPRHVAGICSAFVLVNSSIGLISHQIHGGVHLPPLLYLGSAVILGALIGSSFGTKKLSPHLLQRIFAVILLLATAKLGVGLLG